MGVGWGTFSKGGGRGDDWKSERNEGMKGWYYDLFLAKDLINVQMVINRNSLIMIGIYSLSQVYTKIVHFQLTES